METQNAQQLQIKDSNKKTCSTSLFFLVNKNRSGVGFVLIPQINNIITFAKNVCSAIT